MFTILFCILSVLLPYLGIGVATARGVYGRAMADWRAIDPAEYHDEEVKKARAKIKSLSHEHQDHCYMALMGNRPRYSALYRDGCTCRLKHQMRELNARTQLPQQPPRPQPSIAPVLTWPSYFVTGIITNGDKGRALELEQARLAALERENEMLDRQLDSKRKELT